MTRAIPFIILLAVSPTWAQSGPGGNIDLQAFRPAVDSRGFITLNSSRMLGHGDLSFGLVTNWAKNVLTLENGDNRYEVEHVLSPTLVAAYGLRIGLPLELGVSLPFTIVSGDRSPDSNGGTPDEPNDDADYRFSGQGLGDIGLHLKAQLVPESRVGIGVAVVGSVSFPTASEDEHWLGDSAFGTKGVVVADASAGRFRFGVTGGFRYRSGGNVIFTDNVPLASDGRPQPMTGKSIEAGSTVPLGAAVSYTVVQEKFELVSEIFGEIPLGGENYLPMEAVAGLKLYLGTSSFLTIGGGAGLVRGSGASPDARAFLGIVFEPFVGDRDGDGILDNVDQCPDTPEDKDGFEDHDGCPDPDNDRDGILDKDDECPLIAEDKDGFEDEDGCPEENPTSADSDNDGIIDDLDECDFDPEDLDGFEDDDGCPDPDNDNDGVLDVDDQCPDELENHNGYEDDDGCRDRRTAVTEIEIAILDKIYFEYDSAVIKDESHDLLREIAETINLNPDIKSIEIQGHTDVRGADSYNLRLSQDRAESVRSFLIAEGVSPDRLVARGYGERKPMVRGTGEAVWSQNRRVEFIRQQ